MTPIIKDEVAGDEAKTGFLQGSTNDPRGDTILPALPGPLSLLPPQGISSSHCFPHGPRLPHSLSFLPAAHHGIFPRRNSDVIC